MIGHTPHDYLHPMYLISGLLWRLGVSVQVAYLIWKPVAIAIPDQEGPDALGTPLMPNVALLVECSSEQAAKAVAATFDAGRILL